MKMSKVKIEIDTNEKTMVVKIDGKSVDNVHDVTAFAENSVFGFGVDITSREDVGDMKKFTRIMAMNTEKMEAEVKSSKAIASVRFMGFVISASKDLFRDILGKEK